MRCCSAKSWSRDATALLVLVAFLSLSALRLMPVEPELQHVVSETHVHR